MNNQVVLEVFLIIQLISFGAIYSKKDNILKEWKGWAIDKKIGRTFFLFVPTIVIISILYRPL